MLLKTSFQFQLAIIFYIYLVLKKIEKFEKLNYFISLTLVVVGFIYRPQVCLKITIEMNTVKEMIGEMGKGFLEKLIKIY